MKINRFSILLLVIGAGMLSSCSKKEPAATDAAPEVSAAAKKPGAKEAEVLPGASDIRAAMTAKDYNRAVGGLLALQNVLSTEAQRNEYNVLFQETRDALIDNSTTDRKAAEALAQLRAVRLGR